jgi:predicted Zn-dependent protease
VILDPIAAAGLIEHLAYLAFNALPVQEGRSFLSGKIGRRVFGENITIVDDVRDPQTMGIPFDYEGVPRQKVMLIERGIARGVVHDRVTASRARVRSTGHALPQPNTEGPVPLNIVVSSGNSTLEEMIASTETGVLVNQVHYTNVVDPMRITLTGMTRGGTFWIENGKVTHALRNLRFTESLVDVLNRVDGMTRERLYAGDYLGVVAPGMKVTAFTFTSGTDF